MRRSAAYAFAFLALTGLWESSYRFGWIDPLLIAAPSLIGAAAVKDGAAFLLALRVTALEIAAAVSLAGVLGIAVGLAIGARLRATLVVSPFLSAALAAPLIVLYPVIVAFVGIGPMSKIVYGGLTGFFPITLAAMSGVRAIDTRYLVVARACGASPPQIMGRVIAPLATPSIISGLRIGLSLAIIAVVQSEMLSATDGLGYLISYYRSTFAVGQVYFGVLLVLLLAAAVNAVLNSFEKRLNTWRA